jgi:hypothetical protein
MEAESDEQKNAMASTNRINAVNLPAPNSMIPASETLSASQLIFPLSLGGCSGKRSDATKALLGRNYVDWPAGRAPR